MKKKPYGYQMKRPSQAQQSKKQAEAYEDLRKLNQVNYGGGMNLCYMDGYFAQSLIQKYGMSLDELAKWCGYGGR